MNCRATFSDIADLATGERIPDIAFAGVEIQPEADAAVAQSPSNAEGTDTYFGTLIYGPDNQEISGAFDKGTLIGAFGTKRR